MIASASIKVGRNVDVVGLGGLAYQILMDHRQSKMDQSTELDKVDRFVRALVLELRVVINLLDLAQKADEVGDQAGRNGLLIEIECPLLRAVAMGLNDVPLSREGAEAIIRGVSAPDTVDDNDSRSSSSDSDNQDVIDQLSRMVARLLTVQALARVGDLDVEIKWNVRLKKLRREALEVLKSVLATDGESG